MSITLSSQGSNLVVIKDGVSKTYPKGDVVTILNDPFLELTYNHESMFKIDSHTDVQDPSSSSMSELQSIITDMLDMSGSEGGSEPSGPASISDVQGLSPILRLIGMGSGVSSDAARSFTASDPTIFMVNDISGDNLAIYDASDTSTPDNGTTVLVGSNNRRYKIMNVLKALQLINKVTDIFQ